jgi:hypothetical protein
MALKKRHLTTAPIQIPGMLAWPNADQKSALGCQGIGSATSRGLASEERPQLGMSGLSAVRAKMVQAALARTAVSRSGSKTVLFLSIK